jgi:hypothetical protein
MCKVEMTDSYNISSSYLSAPTSVTSITRGTGLVGSNLTEVQEAFSVSTGKDVGLFVDLANLAQSPWTKPTELFDRIGALLNEAIESAVLGRYASWTDFDNASIGGSAGNITVSASNIDDIIRGVKREIRENNGQSMMNRNGIGFVWRAKDFEYLEAFVQARIIGLLKSSLINGETPEEDNAQQAVLSPYTQYLQLQRLNERTPVMAK